MSIKLSNIYFKYKSDEFDFQVKEFEFPKSSITSIIGPNGSGKTTLLSIITGLNNPKIGDILIDGVQLSSNKNSIMNQLFFASSNSGFYNHLNAFNNLKVHCLYRGISIDVIEKVLDTVNLPNDKKIYKKFSDGMKQKLKIASALLFNPSYILLDEPFNALDPIAVFSLKDLIIELNNQGVTFLIATHLLKEANDLSTHYAILQNGRIHEEQVYLINDRNIEDDYKKLFYSNLNDK